MLCWPHALWDIFMYPPTRFTFCHTFMLLRWQALVSLLHRACLYLFMSHLYHFCSTLTYVKNLTVLSLILWYHIVKFIRFCRGRVVKISVLKVLIDNAKERFSEKFLKSKATLPSTDCYWILLFFICLNSSQKNVNEFTFAIIPYIVSGICSRYRFWSTRYYRFKKRLWTQRLWSNC